MTMPSLKKAPQPLTALAGVIGALVLCYTLLMLCFSYGASFAAGIPWLAMLLGKLASFVPPLVCVFLGRMLLGRRAPEPFEDDGSRLPFLKACLTFMPLLVTVCNLLASGLGLLLPIAETARAASAPQDAASWIILLLFTCLLVPVAEEWFYRGILQPALYPYGQRFAVIFTSLLFALMHYSLINFIPVFLLSGFIGYAAVVLKRARPCVLLHILNNVLACLLTYGVEGKDGLSALGVTLTVMAGCALVGAYGLFQLLRLKSPKLAGRKDPKNQQSRFELVMISPIFLAAVIALIAELLVRSLIA